VFATMNEVNNIYQNITNVYWRRFIRLGPQICLAHLSFFISVAVTCF
jgi:hypothetical protein